MKRMKKKLSILLALTMILSMSMTAFAAGSGSITIENATVGQKYSGYKIFDATWDGDAVSYTIDSSSPWYTKVVADGSPFTLTQVGGTNTYNVGVVDEKTDSEIISIQNLGFSRNLAIFLQKNHMEIFRRDEGNDIFDVNDEILKTIVNNSNQKNEYKELAILFDFEEKR